MYNPELHTRFGGKTGFYSNTYLRFHGQLPYSYTLSSCYFLPITIYGKPITPTEKFSWFNICHCFLELLLSRKCNILHISPLTKPNQQPKKSTVQATKLHNSAE